MGSIGTANQINKIQQTLISLNEQVTQINKTLSTPENDAALNEALHCTDKLPEWGLVNAVKDVVDSMEVLQQKLESSVLLLTDGFFSYMYSKALNAVTKYQVPDVLKARGPLTMEALAAAIDVQPDRLEQLMDQIVNKGVFSYDEATETYANNRASILLCRDHPVKWYLWTEQYGDGDLFFGFSNSIPAAIRNGEDRCAAQIQCKTELKLFDYLSSIGKIDAFHDRLGAGADAMAGGVAVDYPWEELGTETVVDLGGGQGDFLAGILRAHPRLRGSVVDLAHTVALAEKKVNDPIGPFADIATRFDKLYAGDFFGDILPASVYMMKWCPHNWMDDDVVRMMQNTRKYIIPSPTARLILFESVKKAGRSSRLSRYGDMSMMISTNGRERSQKMWERLAGRSGWRLNRIVDIRESWVSAIEFLPEN